MDHEERESAEDIVKRSIELFGLTPEEMSARNEEWMRKKGYKQDIPDYRKPSSPRVPPASKKTSLNTLLERLRMRDR
jgi:hypothetical protein